MQLKARSGPCRGRLRDVDVEGGGRSWKADLRVDTKSSGSSANRRVFCIAALYEMVLQQRQV